MHIRTLVAVTLLATASPALATPAGDAALYAILSEQLKQTADFATQIQTLKTTLNTARENVQLARSVYQGYEELRDFNAERFLARSKLEFLSRNGYIGESTYFADDLARNGVRGGQLDVDLIRRRGGEAYGSLKCQQQLNEFSEGKRPSLDSDCARYGYNIRAATGVAADTERALSDPRTRQHVAYSGAVASSTEGLIDTRLMQTDPELYAKILRARAKAREDAAEAKALQEHLIALGMSPGAAQQATAQAMLLSNKQLADLNETQTQLLALQQLSAAERAQEAAKLQQQQDRAWNGIDRSIDKTFRNAPLPPAPSMSDK